MNLISKSVTKVLSSSLYHSRAAKLPIRKWVISRQITSGGESEAPEKEVAPLKTIKYREELSNSVSLTGVVNQSVQFNSPSDGKFWAGTVICHRSESMVPVIFEGDLAKTAVQHLKKNDLIHVSGKLFQPETFPNSIFQVMAQTFNLVHFPDISTPPDIEETSTEKQPSSSEKDEDTDEEISNTWKHFLENPTEWLDHRGNKSSGLVKTSHPDFTREEDGLSLWLDKAPDWVLPNLEGLEFHVIVPEEKTRQLKDESWKDLAENPHKWWDNRSRKTNPKAPDFKHMETGEGLWMRDSPAWVQSKLPPLKKREE